jgi:hypothetical protein
MIHLINKKYLNLAAGLLIHGVAAGRPRRELLKRTVTCAGEKNT